MVVSKFEATAYCDVIMEMRDVLSNILTTSRSRSCQFGFCLNVWKGGGRAQGAIVFGPVFGHFDIIIPMGKVCRPTTCR